MFLSRLFRRRKEQHLAAIRAERLTNIREDWSHRRRSKRWGRIPYGKAVQVMIQRVREDPPVGSVGNVLSEEGHGITHYPGYTVMTPKFPGIRGYDVLVSFKEGEPPKLLDIGQLAPAYGV